MKFLVLASNSFTGSHFVEYLLEKTDAEVVGLSRSDEYNPIFLPYLYQKPERPKRFQFHKLDVNRDFDQIESLILKFKPEYVVNFAAQGEVRNSWKWPEQWYATNALGVVRLSQVLIRLDSLKKYVAASTPEVYGTTGLNVEESHCYLPSTPYGVSKLVGDLHMLAYHKRYGTPVAFTRAANLYGIHQQLYRIIPKTVIALKKKEKIKLHGRGLASRAFVHARDVADATYRVCMNGTNGETYHVAPDDELLSIADLVKMICTLRGHNFEDSVELVDENFGQDALFSLSAKKIRNDLGWSPHVTLQKGIEEVIAWVEKNWAQIAELPAEYIHKP